MKSSNIFKNIEQERQNFAWGDIKLFGEVLPSEEGIKLFDMGIEKECSLRRKMNVVAIWLSAEHEMSFEEIKKRLDPKEVKE